MLGGADDLAAILSVLDRLSNELETNRQALDASLKQTDDIGVDMPLGLISPTKQAELLRKVRQEARDCEFLRESVESFVSKAEVAAQLARGVAEAQSTRENEIHRTAGRELVAWQAEVERLADECASIAAAEAEIDGKLAKLYTKVRVAGAKHNVG